MIEDRANDIQGSELRPCPDPPLKWSASIRKQSLSRDEMERRRIEAGKDMLKGFPQAGVPRKFGVSRTTASRWHFALAANGLESLRGRKSAGRRSRLVPGQKAQIIEILEGGASLLGFASNRWTGARLARVIEERFGVEYSPDYVGHLMGKLRPHRCNEQLRSTSSVGGQWQPS